VRDPCSDAILRWKWRNLIPSRFPFRQARRLGLPLHQARPLGLRDSEIIVALIAASAAIVGALAGGFATYLGNKSLQESQSRSSAVGIGRVVQSRLHLASAEFQTMLNHGALIRPDPGIGQIVSSTQDEETLASNLNVTDWNKVAIALADYELFTELGTQGDVAAQAADSAGAAPFVGQDRSVVTMDMADARAALHALSDLTDHRNVGRVAWRGALL
jgi:hypothetical protein